MGEIEEIKRDLPTGLPATRYVATEMMEQRKYNPLMKLCDLDELLSAEILKEGYVDMEVVKHLITIRKELAKYFAPQVRSVDVNINQSNSMSVNIMRFDAPEPPPIQIEGSHFAD